MAKPKETPATVAPAVEPAEVVEAAAIDVQVAVESDKDDRLIAALGDMNHDDPQIWDADGKPNVKYLSAIIDEEVTRADVDAIDPNFKCMPATDEEKGGPVGDVVLELPPEEPKARVYTQADLKAIDAEWQAALDAKAEVLKALKEVEARRDPIVNALAHNPTGQSFAHVVQEMQRATQAAAMARVGHIAAFKKMTGGVMPSLYPSKLDERAATRRSVQRRAARD